MTSITILITGVSKVYDGSTTTYDRVDYSVDRTNPDPQADPITLNNPTITVTYTSANVGTNKNVSINIALTGADVNKYTISSGSSRTGNIGTITTKMLQISPAVEVNNKIYDGTTAATFTGGNISGFADGESFTFIGTFADANADDNTNKLVTFKVSDATIAANYQYGLPGENAAKYAKITKKDLAIIEVAAENKTYDGTNTAVISGGTISGKIDGDDVVLDTLGRTGIFTDAGASDIPKTVTVSGYTLTGAQAGNYNLEQPTGVTATIAKKLLTVSDDAVIKKAYDGNLTATLSGIAKLNDIVSTDNVAINTRNATYDNPNAGNNKTITIVTTLSGDKSGNYYVADTTTTSIEYIIDAKILTITDVTAINKEYDGNTTATVSNTCKLNGLIGTQTLTTTLVGTFVSANAGNQNVNVTVTLANATSGNIGFASNYSITNPTVVSATINKKPLTIKGVTAADKIFDGTTTASFSNNGTLDGLVTGESLNTTLVGTFADADLGTNKPVTARVTLADVTGINGGLASNYSITNPTGLTASIIAPFAYRYPSVKFSTTKSSSFKPSIFGEMTPTKWKISKELPSGITINSKTGVISGTATARFDELPVIVYASKDNYNARYSLSIKCE